MIFWENAFKWGWADADLLRMVVITDQLPNGELTKEDFKRITGENFEPVTEPEPVVEKEEPAADPEPKKK